MLSDGEQQSFENYYLTFDSTDFMSVVPQLQPRCIHAGFLRALNARANLEGKLVIG